MSIGGGLPVWFGPLIIAASVSSSRVSNSAAAAWDRAGGIARRREFSLVAAEKRRSWRLAWASSRAASSRRRVAGSPRAMSHIVRWTYAGSPTGTPTMRSPSFATLSPVEDRSSRSATGHVGVSVPAGKRMVDLARFNSIPSGSRRVWSQVATAATAAGFLASGAGSTTVMSSMKAIICALATGGFARKSRRSGINPQLYPRGPKLHPCWTPVAERIISVDPELVL